MTDQYAAMAGLPSSPPQTIPNDVAVLTVTVADEAGSRLCDWIKDSSVRVCTRKNGRSFCLCQNVAKAMLHDYHHHLEASGFKIVATKPAPAGGIWLTEVSGDGKRKQVLYNAAPSGQEQK